MMTIKDINDALRQRCKDLELTYQCGADGAVGAEIAVVSEAPADREVSLGMPLVGNAGKTLWTELRKYNITRTQCYITNVYKRQVAFQTGKATIGADEKQHWVSMLKWELSRLPNLKYVLR